MHYFPIQTFLLFLPFPDRGISNYEIFDLGIFTAMQLSLQGTRHSFNKWSLRQMYCSPLCWLQCWNILLLTQMTTNWGLMAYWEEAWTFTLSMPFLIQVFCSSLKILKLEGIGLWNLRSSGGNFFHSDNGCIWNKLPEDVIEVDTFVSFKNPDIWIGRV